MAAAIELELDAIRRADLRQMVEHVAADAVGGHKIGAPVGDQQPE